LSEWKIPLTPTSTTCGQRSPTRSGWRAGSARWKATSGWAGTDDETVVEAELSPDGDATRIVVEERGLPIGAAAAFGAGWQAHVEDLAAHLAGRPQGQWRERWAELKPAYLDQQAALG